ncbi:glycoside hydrolase family 62 protein [Bipolaris maydis ATCC 48331]|uniref:Alpha-L-arabinofuranosidase n=2 Tax=Cochliobolus heterostrophus TaxID=5016 RepID=M2U6K0_COCH5|nr:glycoside hydrolase family 62 protein [Bipolaris maydis ATCC 48331]EMD94144.1 glycoside hydrolase family 62 protein [Bipolaris maydis C5]KAH7564040.1 glycoside hydrolase family 62 protein [Bipolaris maydis]ENI07556.1 glycoside hydrolase family 62 protein [Bipolaris maydis ATCC 48331]KAJ5026665.1 glycoside hydrolase [Bipolaris maydis]KAJ5059599.1 alpha-L-arab-like proteininofuranosidase precursor [Bipolaris maydis]
MRSFLLAGAAFAASVLARSLPLYEHAALETRQNTGGLPNTFTWSSSGVLVSPKQDSRQIQGIKDPTIIQNNGVYHVFASTAKEAGYNLVYFNFTDFSRANQAPFFYLDQSGIGTGYRAAPQVFYFAPQKLWYLIYQNGNAAYSTNPDISNPRGWTAPQVFYPNGTPQTIQNGLGTTGYWVDMWVICDTALCHLYSSDDNGGLYRSQTPVSQFPRGMNEPVVTLKANKNDLFEASTVYNIVNTSTYLLMVECIGSGNSPGGLRYFRSWTTQSLTSDKWTPLAASQQTPFLGAANTQFPAGRWSQSLSHGELVRTNVDQRLQIRPCEMRYLYQGIDPNATGTYNALPWKLALATQTNSKC